MEKLKTGETLNLKYPVDVSGRRYDSLTLRRPLVEDLLIRDEMIGSDGKKEIYFQANLSGVEPTVIQKLDVVDQRRLADRINTVFLEASEASE